MILWQELYFYCLHSFWEQTEERLRVKIWEKNVLIPPFIDISGKINESKSIVYRRIIIIQLSNGLDKYAKNVEGEWS